MDVTINHLTVQLLTKPDKIWESPKLSTKLLNDIHAHVSGGSMCAILGGSGSGKTTLLNVIANRYNKNNFNVEGNVQFGFDKDYNLCPSGISSATVGYVTQEDFLLPFLTARETLYYAAQLQLPYIDGQSSNERKLMCDKKVDAIIRQLGLKECADSSHIGGSSSNNSSSSVSFQSIINGVRSWIHKATGLFKAADEPSGSANTLSVGGRGLSGGQRRRVSVGIQLLNNPQVLCADECTSGLDSFTALTVIQALKRFQEYGEITYRNSFDGNGAPPAVKSEDVCPVTIIATIHQPRVDIFELFDSFILLAEGGRLVYSTNTCQDFMHATPYGEIRSSLANGLSFDEMAFIRGSITGVRPDLQHVVGPQNMEIEEGSAVDKMIRYFGGIGFECPNNCNPADYFIDVCTNTKQKKENDLISFLCACAQIAAESQPKSDDADLVVIPIAVSKRRELKMLMREIVVLYKRFVVNNSRDIGNITGLFLEAFIMAWVVVGIFFQLDDSIESITSIPGLIYVLLSSEPYILSIILVDRYTTELRVMDRELLDDFYAIFSYLSSFMMSFYPILLFKSLITAVIVYFGANMRLGAAYFFDTYATISVISLYISGLSLFSAASSRQFSIASLICNATFTFICLTGGFLVSFSSLPAYVSWIQYFSMFNYGFKILMTDQLYDRVFPCPYDSGVPGECDAYMGNSILSEYSIGYPLDPAVTWLPLLLLVFGYHSVAYYLLETVRFPPGQGGGLAEKKPIEIQDEYVEVPAVQEVLFDQRISRSTNILAVPSTADTRVIICVNNVSLYVNNAVRSITKSAVRSSLIGNPMLLKLDNAKVNSSPSAKCILDNVSCQINPGRLTALMGGSGSGKTTLLNIVVGRINSLNTDRLHTVSNSSGQSELTFSDNTTSVYSMNGNVTYMRLHNSKSSVARTNSVLSFVEQSDSHLPNLTVYETLLFSAQIKLPESVSLEEKELRVKNVLEQLNLMTCAQVRVGGVMDGSAEGGNPNVRKTLSGGQMRRLSIAIQMIVDTPVYVLDEPTSGLDSYSALQVVLLLQNIASSRQRTILLSIHQPRYDLFRCFEDVILLTRGSLVWSGKRAKMLSHFEKCLQIPCPKRCNPADFYLDMSSIDFRSNGREQESWARVQVLIDNSITNVNPAIKRAADEELAKLFDKFNGSVVYPHRILFSLPLLMWRSCVNVLRQPDVLIGRTSQGLFLGLISALFYAPIGYDQQSVQNRIGCLFFLSSICFIGILNCIAVFFSERNVFYREYRSFVDENGMCAGNILDVDTVHSNGSDDIELLIRNRSFEVGQDNVELRVVNSDGNFVKTDCCNSNSNSNRGYSVLAFYLSYIINAFPFVLLAACGVGFLQAVVINLNSSGYGFFSFSYVAGIELLIGECIGVIFCAIFFHVGFSVNTMSATLSALCMIAGLVSVNMSAVMNAINFITPFKYGAWIVMNVAFKDLELDCDSADMVNGTCVSGFTNGNQVLQLYKMTDAYQGDMTAHVITITVICMVFLALGYGILLYRAYLLSVDY